MTKEFLLHKEKEEKRKSTAHSVTFCCPNPLATALRQKSLHFADPHSTLLISL
jgi:hypothetical protein